MNRKQKKLVRILAIVLAVLLAGGAITAAIISFAYAEEGVPQRNQVELTMEYLEEEQALRVSQRLVYRNASGAHLDRVLFYVPANTFRRSTSLVCDAEDLDAAFPKGYLPGGAEITSVRVNGADADWGMQGEDEITLRAACDLDSGESCEFAFEYYLLLTENGTFLGSDAKSWRLTDFCMIPAVYDAEIGDFILSTPVPFTRWIHTPAADWSASIALPEQYALAATGEESFTVGDRAKLWTVRAENARDFGMVIFKKDKPFYSVTTGSGVELRCVADKNDEKVLRYAQEAVYACEAWFGPFPRASMDFVQTDYAAGALSRTGMLLLSKAELASDDLRRDVYFSVAQQYFGFSAYAESPSDAWLSDSVCEYLCYLILEETDSHDAYLKELNARVVPSLQMTIPGGLRINSSGDLFTAREHEIVVLNRGAAVFHELRTAMGREKLIAGLRNFYETGLRRDVLTEMDLVEAMDAASGGSWEKFLTDWVFNIDQYVNQSIDWLD